MSDREAAMLDHQFAAGMRLALAMASQGAWEQAREIADRRMTEALHVIVATRAQGTGR